MVCPHCNYRNANISTDKVTCHECGEDYDNTQSFCPSCGCPNNKTTPKKKKHKGMIITSIILSVVIIIGLLGSFIINTGKAEVYSYNLETVTYKMLDGAAKAETAGNLIKSVWYNAIYEERDNETDKYTMKNGKFVDDFNDALDMLFSDESFIASISEIESNQSEVLELMKALKSPPKEYEEAYSVLKDYYENYSKMIKIVINPTGSLNTFSEDFNTYDTETVELYEKMRLYLD